MEKGLEAKWRRIEYSIQRIKDISDRLRDGDISPGMRQSLRRQYLEVEKNLRHQVKALYDFMTGSYIEVTFKQGQCIFVSSFINCTKEQAEKIVRSYRGNPIEILEIKEKFANPQPVKL